MENNRKSVAYVIPELSLYGGVAVCLQHAKILCDNGLDVTVIVKKIANEDKFSFTNKCKIITTGDALKKEFDTVIATHHSTVSVVEKIKSNHKIYFVQSDERRFFPEIGNLFEECEDSYKKNFTYMTEAFWIQRWLKEEFNHDAYYVPNGIDLNIFHKTKPLIPKSKKPRILIEGSIDVWYKGMDDAYAAVKDLDCELWIVSNNGKPKKGWKYDKFFENVPFEKMKEIYSSCDIFLKMSRIEGFFGPPMEAMACGCAVVVGKVTGYDEYIEHGKNALVVEMRDVDGAKKVIQGLIDDKKLREELIKGGYEIVKEWRWDRTRNFLMKVMNFENPVAMYSQDFPLRYDFIEQLKDNTIRVIREKGKIIEILTEHSNNLLKEVVAREMAIRDLKNSKLMKLQNLYLKIKHRLKK